MVAQRIDPSVRVEFTGPLTGPAKTHELAWANVFAFPSSYRNEGQPLVVIEALAAGLPIITTSHRGIPDTVIHDRNAILIEPGDVAALAAALERLAGDERLRARLAVAAGVATRTNTSRRPSTGGWPSCWRGACLLLLQDQRPAGLEAVLLGKLGVRLDRLALRLDGLVEGGRGRLVEGVGVGAPRLR